MHHVRRRGRRDAGPKLDASRALAVCVDGAGSTSEVDLGLVAGVAPGDELLVHAGVALARLEPEAAA